MLNPFVGELALVPYNFAPKGWALCNGQLLAINQNQALFAVLGATYGGNGQTNFALPDLRGRVPVSSGQGPGLENYNVGQTGGVEHVTLTAGQMPAHNHVANATNNNGAVPLNFGNYLGAFNNGYAQPANLTPLHPQTIGNVGGSQAHTNMQPYLGLTFCIALQGIFPSQT